MKLCRRVFAIAQADRIGSHNSKAVRQLTRSVAARTLFLSKYSPDLNPVEQAFARLKHLLRKAAARTADAVCAAIAAAPETITRQLPQKPGLSMSPEIKCSNSYTSLHYMNNTH